MSAWTAYFLGVATVVAAYLCWDNSDALARLFYRVWDRIKAR